MSINVMYVRSIFLVLILGILTISESLGEDVLAGRKHKDDSRQWVALTALVSDPERFDGQWLTTFGYFLVDREQSALCPQARMASTVDCIFVTIGGGVELNKLGGRAVMVKGKFSARASESAEFYSGSLMAVRARAVPEVENAAR